MVHNRSHKHQGHEHGQGNYNRAFAIGTALNIGFVIVEAVYGYRANSLALVADAGHNLSDVLGLLLAWEAVRRFSEPNSVSGGTVIGVAVVGIIINTVTALMFLSGRQQDLNIRGAFLHMAADAGVSLGVVLAGIAIVFTGWLWFDPVVSLIIVVVVVVGTWQLLKDSVNLALDAVPQGIEPLAVQTYLTERPGVAGVHDLHIWAMSTTETALTAHLIMPAGHPGDAFLVQVNQELHDHFGIEHATLQIETGDPRYPCTLAPKNVV
ncbi:cation diffusion facilitator family transporter [Nostoc sp. B(2019)]|uniref:Cation transporter n=1 Tax=Nostoc cf. edaphicum LEGE 07299 TaxID=2777974 RepID=A0ABR9TYB8_9NOSO|nr:cation diffusion facilitator family transporter [Nostoc edaphicum]MBE9105035.1 cation transporter [Nostoc cf. edaphicum LEGE 07299]NDJ24411.1 cation diffusion facilitator family transporter [Nostoc sp. B(2019)]